MPRDWEKGINSVSIEKKNIANWFTLSLQITNKILEYVYEAAMEETYMQYLVKSFKKTVADGHFDFIIVDCVNSSLKHYTEMYNFAKTYAFTVRYHISKYKQILMFIFVFVAVYMRNGT